MIQGHGGNIFELALHLGCDPADICDMSSNVNPLGPMPELMAHLHRHLDRIRALPEVDAATITAAFARSCGLPPDRVLAGNGSTEIIYLLPRVLAPPRAVVLGPTYADYADACRLAGVEVHRISARAEDAFAPPMNRLRAELRPGDLVFVCNPNNPTGVLADGDALIDLAASHHECLFLVDESYLPFAGGVPSLAGRAPDNMLVLSSLSKIHRIPGLRIGFLIGPPPLISRLASHRLPWNVNAMAQAAVGFLAANPEPVARFVEQTWRFLDAEKAVLAQRLAGSRQVRVFDSRTSFVLLQLAPPATAGWICAAMAEKRILVRNCDNFSGLDNSFVRLSLKETDDNARAAACLLDALAAATDS